MTLDTPRILGLFALACAVGAAVILVTYVVRRPPLDRATKLWLFLGLGPFPIAAALSGNVANFELTKQRRFCGSCHVMDPYVIDSGDLKSETLASAHSRNPWFGDQSCYVCHADYGMFGTITTKIGGMHHVWDYYTDDWSRPGHRPPKLYKPYSNVACRQCHPESSAIVPIEHRVHMQALGKDQVGCANAECHGPVHPSHRGKVGGAR